MILKTGISGLITKPDKKTFKDENITGQWIEILARKFSRVTQSDFAFL